MAELYTLEHLFIHEMRDLYDAERRLTTAIPRLIAAAHSSDLRHALTSHLKQTETHVARLDHLFEMFNETPRGKTCEGIRSLIAESEHLMTEDAGEAICDAGLIAAAQKVEHYEISGYGTLVTWAALLERNEATRLLELTLVEEKQADLKLTEIARTLNMRAVRA